MKCQKPWKKIQDEYKIRMELVPPGSHRSNAAEVAIRNFKAHLPSVLAGTEQDFRPSLWDRLLPQSEITINLLWKSNATPNVSDYTHMSGPFYYNKMSLAPMGISVQVHEKTDKRGTWAYHSVDGWYLAKSTEQYCTHRCHIKTTNNEQSKGILHFSHRKITRPTITHADKVMADIAECAKAIKNLGNDNGDGSDEMQQLVWITDIAIHHKPYIVATPTTTSSNPEILRLPLNNNKKNHVQQDQWHSPPDYFRQYPQQ